MPQDVALLDGGDCRQYLAGPSLQQVRRWYIAWAVLFGLITAVIILVKNLIHTG
jgi:hypothetical protein